MCSISPPPPQNLTQLWEAGKSSSYRGPLYEPEMLQGVWKTAHIYTAITVLTHPIKLYYHILHLTWSLHTSKLFHQTLLSCLTKAPTCELPVCEEHRFGLLSTEIH